MKRWGLLAAAALLSIGTALAEEEPSRPYPHDDFR